VTEGPAAGWFGQPLPRRSRQLIPAPVAPVEYRTFDLEFLEWVRDRLRGLWSDPAPETTRATRAYLGADGE
jgi:hypothetical protein